MPRVSRVPAVPQLQPRGFVSTGISSPNIFATTGFQMAVMGSSTAGCLCFRFEWVYDKKMGLQVCHHCRFRKEYEHDRADYYAKLASEKCTDDTLRLGPDVFLAMPDRGEPVSSKKRKVFILPRRKLVSVDIETSLLKPMQGNKL